MYGPSIAYRSAMSDHFSEGTGTLLAMLVAASATLLGFVVLGALTHVVVEVTVGNTRAGWRAAAGAVAGMFLVASVGALLFITGRGLSLLPARRRERHEHRPGP